MHALISDTNKKQGSLLINVPKIAITFEKYHFFLKCNVNLFCINHLALTITSLATSTGSMQCENKQFKLELGVEGGLNGGRGSKRGNVVIKSVRGLLSMHNIIFLFN